MKQTIMQQINYEQSKIKYTTQNYSIHYLLDHCDLNPQVIVKHKSASKYLESIILQSPVIQIPIIVKPLANHRFQVIDGQKRLKILHRFFNNQFTLTGLTYLTKLNQLTYQEIPNSDAILKTSLRVIILNQNSNPELEADLKSRINRFKK